MRLRSILTVFWPLLAATAVFGQTYSVIYNFNSTGDPNTPTGPDFIAQGRDGNLYSSSAHGGALGQGAFFDFTPSGSLSVPYNFTGLTDGGTPYGGVTLGSDGNFYGTNNLGAAGYGSIFKITPGGTLTVLHTFTGADADGANPYAAPIQGADGNFYGTTFGADGVNSTIYKVTPVGTFTNLRTLSDAEGSQIKSPLAAGTDGNLYGTAYSGGAQHEGTIYKITPNGVFTLLHSFMGADGASPAYGLIQTSDGNFYGTTTSGSIGGLSDWGAIFSITPAGAFTGLFSPRTTDDGTNPSSGLVQATDGNLYGAMSIFGTQSGGTLYKITTGGVYTVLYDFEFNGLNGWAPASSLTQATNGILYGDTTSGGLSSRGVVYSLNIGASALAKLTSTSGKVGATIGILGQGFTGTTAVKFGSVVSSFTVVSATYLTAVVPVGALTGTVRITTPTGLLTTGIFRVTPTVTSFSPHSGAVGTLVTINGTGLTQTTKVTFSGNKAAAFTVVSDSRITATVPTGAVTGKITITTKGGTAKTAAAFTVL